MSRSMENAQPYWNWTILSPTGSTNWWDLCVRRCRTQKIWVKFSVVDSSVTPVLQISPLQNRISLPAKDVSSSYLWMLKWISKVWWSSLTCHWLMERKNMPTGTLISSTEISPISLVSPCRVWWPHQRWTECINGCWRSMFAKRGSIVIKIQQLRSAQSFNRTALWSSTPKSVLLLFPYPCQLTAMTDAGWMLMFFICNGGNITIKVRMSKSCSLLHIWEIDPHLSSYRRIWHLGNRHSPSL